MSKNMVMGLWASAFALAFIVFIGGWVMGDVGIGFPAFVVRWILPSAILIAFGYYRSNMKKQH